MDFSIIDEVNSICYRLCKSKAEADDLRQLALYKIFKNRDSVLYPKYLRTWIRNIVINTFIDEFYRTKRETPLSYLKESACLYEMEGNEACVMNYTFGKDEANMRSYNRLSSVLTSVERNVIEKTVIQGYSSKDVCENMNLTPNVLAKTKKRAMKKMKNIAKLSDYPPSLMS